MGVLPDPFQQTFEVNVGAQISSVDFSGSTRQFDWMEISLVNFKSYEHETIYDSYDVELAANLIESVNFVNVSKPYTLSGKIRFDTNNRDENTFSIKCLSLINVMAQQTHHELITKIIQSIKI